MKISQAVNNTKIIIVLSGVGLLAWLIFQNTKRGNSTGGLIPLLFPAYKKSADIAKTTTKTPKETGNGLLIMGIDYNEYI